MSLVARSSALVALFLGALSLGCAHRAPSVLDESVPPARPPLADWRTTPTQPVPPPAVVWADTRDAER